MLNYLLFLDCSQLCRLTVDLPLFDIIELRSSWIDLSADKHHVTIKRLILDSRVLWIEMEGHWRVWRSENLMLENYLMIWHLIHSWHWNHQHIRGFFNEIFVLFFFNDSMKHIYFWSMDNCKRARSSGACPGAFSWQPYFLIQQKQVALTNPIHVHKLMELNLVVQHLVQ